MRLSEIYYDIDKSVFITERNNYKYYFSSKFYKEKFDREIEEFLKTEGLKFMQKYKLDYSINLDNMLSLLLYRKIEKRGFYVLKDDKSFKIRYTLEDL